MSERHKILEQTRSTFIICSALLALFILLRLAGSPIDAWACLQLAYALAMPPAAWIRQRRKLAELDAQKAAVCG